MKKPIILYLCPHCKDTKFFGIEDESEDYFLYKCRECGLVIGLSKLSMEKKIQ